MPDTYPGQLTGLHRAWSERGSSVPCVNRTIRHRSADWMARHLVDEASPELAHLREDAALWRPKRQRKYSAIRATRTS